MKKGYNLLILKALDFFLDNPYEKIHLRDFSRRLGISPNSANRFLNLFLEENLITDSRVANLRYFIANIDSVSFRQMKITKNVKLLEDAGLVELLGDNCISCMLFGSCAKGRDDSFSDMDFVIVTKNKEKVRQAFRLLQKKFNRELSYHIFTSLEWRKQKTENKAFYQDVVSSGIALVGEILI
jgi:predicted nucleotidyltransferase